MRKKDSSANPHQGHRENVRRRYVAGGLEAFAPHEILELLLYYAIPQKDTNPLAHRLIDAYGSLSRVLSASAEELQSVEGVGERTASFLSLVFQIGRWIRLEEKRPESVNFLSAEFVGQYVRELFAGRECEAVCELCLNQRGNLIMCHDAANGSIVSVSTDIRSLLQNAIFSNSEYVVIARNHPGGKAVPTPEDYASARRLQEAFRNVHIKLYDHIIVGDGDYVSLRESGFFD